MELTALRTLGTTPRIWRPWTSVCWVAFTLSWVGCSTTSPPVVETPLKTAIRQQGIAPVDVIVPFELDEEMARWAHDAIPPDASSSVRLEALSQALLEPGELDLTYAWGFTGTARQVFETRQANCLAFTNLFLAMAREVDVPVFFLAVETETYRRHGDLVVVSDHIAVGYGTGQDVEMFDFSPREGTELRRVRRISDLTALAMFHSNRGAEALQDGRYAEALDSLRLAVRLQPELASGWVNLGVARRRVGDPEGAELAYRRALEVDPQVYTAYQNLTSLLSSQERHEEAQWFAKTLRQSPNRNPFTYISLGDISLRSGRLTEARRFYKRAVHLNRDDAESYAALGQLAMAQGDVNTARRMLRKARRIDGENARTLTLARMMNASGV